MAADSIIRRVMPVAICLLGCTGTGGIAFAQLQASNPGWPASLADLPQWLLDDPNPWLLVNTSVSAILAVLGAWAAIAQLRAPNPHTERQAKADRQHLNESFAAKDGLDSDRHDEVVTGQTKLAEQMANQTRLIAELTARLVATGQAAPPQAESFEAAATALAQSDSAADRSIAAEIVEGDPVEAADRLMAEVRANRTWNADRARQAARIYAPFSVAKAISAYAEAVDLDPADVWSWIELCRLHTAAGSLTEARRCAERAEQYAANPRDSMIVQNELGDVAYAEGKLGPARAHFLRAMEATAALVAPDPGNSECRRDLSVSHERLGDVAVTAGDLAEARRQFAAGLVIAEKLAGSDPGNAGWQRDLFVSHAKLAQLAAAEGDSAGAIRGFEVAEAIIAALATARPEHPGFARDLAYARSRLDGLRPD